MRLGVVFAGDGAHAAANMGVLEELWDRGTEPYAVCGLHAGAWPAALFCAGLDGAGMRTALAQAARMGVRLADAPLILRRNEKQVMFHGRRIEHLLRLQTGDRMMALCPRRAMIPCRAAAGGRRVVFSSQLYQQESGAMLAMQAGVGFAARAAMALPPFLPVRSWMGSPLIPDGDVAFACSQLLRMGAQRILVCLPVPSPRRVPDSLELAGAHVRIDAQNLEIPQARVLHITMPDDAGALSFDRLLQCAEHGKEAARTQLDALFDLLGMAQCRVLPFRRPEAGRRLGC